MNKRFLILTTTIMIAGFSQGLLLPVLSTLLEREGISSTYNGLSSSSLYIGMLIVSPFLEAPLRKWGYKPMIIIGIITVTLSISLFPLWMNFYFWIILRFLVGIGDSALHFATQVWITSTVLPEKRGKSISLYGLSYGLGFAIGPLGLMLLKINDWIPFYSAVALFIVATIPILKLRNEKPQSKEENNSKQISRYLRVVSIAGVYLMPFFSFGFLEASLNSIFPVYGYRTGLGVSAVSLILSSFVIGSLLFQLPLGAISDRVGRKKVLVFVTMVGGLLLISVPFTSSLFALYLIFALTGGLIGSLYSLGLANIADIISPTLLPTANIIATILFGIGSMVGPYTSGYVMDSGEPDSMFILIGAIVSSFGIIALFHRLKSNSRVKTNTSI